MKNSFPIAFNHELEPYTGTVTAMEENKDLLHTIKFRVELNNNVSGEIEHLNDLWFSDDIADKKLLRKIGEYIDKWIA